MPLIIIFRDSRQRRLFSFICFRRLSIYFSPMARRLSPIFSHFATPIFLRRYVMKVAYNQQHRAA